VLCQCAIDGCEDFVAAFRTMSLDYCGLPPLFVVCIRRSSRSLPSCCSAD